MTMKPHRDPVFRDRDEWRARAERAEAEVEENIGVIQALRRRAEKAEAAPARVRALVVDAQHRHLRATGRRDAVVAAADVLAAIEEEK